ncbi:hypothetical protein K437DRAFT_155534 [Tilletiaria anomala UBC 951]|uniref:Uncharacterized protein n=1 Tax=Tilletiaria anomala (strain ATCC 24038 / CBS 436.72 / UBC 951) TaxID=1037660 RepID=A0A066VRV0_TILAU|nr:uncharacterized protein K437DRAFT_155534 [Tilletiaria anomala UBC 951]KDN42993.1 hypothetical protein K437DRAFT_155534 [Tilletiaria anomala UBC 951]
MDERLLFAWCLTLRSFPRKAPSPPSVSPLPTQAEVGWMLHGCTVPTVAGAWPLEKCRRSPRPLFGQSFLAFALPACPSFSFPSTKGDPNRRIETTSTASSHRFSSEEERSGGDCTMARDPSFPAHTVVSTIRDTAAGVRLSWRRAKGSFSLLCAGAETTTWIAASCNDGKHE